MRKLLSFSVAVALVALSSVAGRADITVIDQIGAGPFTPTTYLGGTIGLSVFDTSADLGSNQLPNFATAYDSFTVGADGKLSSISWIGGFNDVPGPTPAENFTVNIYNDVGGAPPAWVIAPGQNSNAAQTLNVGTNFTRTAVGNDLFQYTATGLNAANFNFTAGQTYWVSVVNNIDGNLNDWGWAFSATPGTSFQDFGDVFDAASGVTRFADTANYAFSVSVVPEPTSALALVLGAGVLAFRRRRSA